MVRSTLKLIEEKQNRNFSSEAKFSASKSSGPGGQNVNKVNTKVELRFCVSTSKLLSEEEKQIILEKLSHKINLEQELIVVSQSERSQLGNKEVATEKLNLLIENALKKEKKRIATKVPNSIKQKRLKNKKILSEKKGYRKPPSLNE